MSSSCHDETDCVLVDNAGFGSKSEEKSTVSRLVDVIAHPALVVCSKLLRREIPPFLVRNTFVHPSMLLSTNVEGIKRVVNVEATSIF